jgi:hypothetical protein
MHYGTNFSYHVLDSIDVAIGAAVDSELARWARVCGPHRITWQVSYVPNKLPFSSLPRSHRAAYIRDLPPNLVGASRF